MVCILLDCNIDVILLLAIDRRSILSVLTHWGRVTHICVVKLTIIGSDNDLSTDRRQAIIWINAGILSIGPLGTKLSEILIAIYIFSFKKMFLKISSAKWRSFCHGLNVLTKIIDETCETSNTLKWSWYRIFIVSAQGNIGSSIVWLALHCIILASIQTRDDMHCKYIRKQPAYFVPVSWLCIS